MAKENQNQIIYKALFLITLAITIEMAMAAAIPESKLYRRLGCGTAGETGCGKGGCKFPSEC